MKIATIIALALLLIEPAQAQKVYSTRFAVHGGFSIPAGEFAGSSHASTGFTLGGYVVMTNIRELSVLTSVMFATIPVDAAVQPNIETRVSNWKLVYLMLGLRGEHIINQGNDKIYGLGQAGVLFAKSPVVTYDYLTRDAIGTGDAGFLADGDKANALAVSAGAGFLFTKNNIDRYDVRLQFLYAEPVFGFGSAARRMAIQQVQLQVGYLFD
jgi:hypothetical protein